MDNTESVFQIPVGLPCLERGRLVKKKLGSGLRIVAEAHVNALYSVEANKKEKKEAKNFFSYIVERI